MFYYFECSTPEVKNWLKVAKEFGWNVADYTNNREDFVLYVQPDGKWAQSAYHTMKGKDNGQKLSLKELTELIVNQKVPEPTKLYFKDLKVGDKFYFNDPYLFKTVRIKCKGTGVLLNKDVYLHSDLFEIEELHTAFKNTQVIKVD
jgi:hypothetical protein